MWHDNRGTSPWRSLAALLAVTLMAADTAFLTFTTLAAIVIGTVALVVLWWYLVRRDRRRD